MADGHVCQVTGRVRHLSRGAARAAARDAGRVAAEQRRGKTPRSVYRCGLCGGWHVSSMSRAQYLKWPGRRMSRVSGDAR